MHYPPPRRPDRSGPTKERELISFIERTDFPCVGAKSALNQGGLYILHARSLTSAWNDVALHTAVVRFAEEHGNRKRGFRSLIILFEGPLNLSERNYEKYLWERLQSWTDKDVWLGYKNDASVSSDPKDTHFSLSFGGHAFFAVGLHPRASRKARRFFKPAIVLNLHSQFQNLRDQGKYEGMRKAILQRDRKFQGSINPMLSRFGTSSEAPQYSGRKVDNNWQCPFKRRELQGNTEDHK
ncbi:guanitoxin biosynthesis heme-dependent pre-guanitoxin N-hydroxylase GntA [Parasphingorhabdus sp.]|uniref:guanitoxin biosynthesis heme-dependent pre-guanitoxin N-hydroxylase GntA n=1 Tax=Parasphingorhabdus sp. TaxID=2709688 RepID=UPI0039C9DD41